MAPTHKVNLHPPPHRAGKRPQVPQPPDSEPHRTVARDKSGRVRLCWEPWQVGWRQASSTMAPSAPAQCSPAQHWMAPSIPVSSPLESGLPESRSQGLRLVAIPPVLDKACRPPGLRRLVLPPWGSKPPECLQADSIRTERNRERCCTAVSHRATVESMLPDRFEVNWRPPSNWWLRAKRRSPTWVNSTSHTLP
jgi:hypothetical protein